MAVEKIETPLWDLCEWADQVYEPREDSFFLLDTLEEELSFIRSLNPTHILEIGPGSGIIIAAMAKAFKNSNCMAVDINPFACLTTQKTALLNKVTVNVIQSDLILGLRQDQLIDVLIFNPPYVPSDPDEEKDLIDKAWAGKAKGRCTVDRLFPMLPDFMSNNSVGYIVALDENDPDEMCSVLQELGFAASIIKKRRLMGERLSVLKFVWKKY